MRTTSWFSKLLQISDSAFPTGSFGHSQGLDYAIRNHWIKSRQDLESWSQGALTHSLIPLDGRACLKSWSMQRRFDEREWLALNEEVESMRPSEGQRRASTEIGRAFLRSATVSLGLRPVTADVTSVLQWPTVWGMICFRIGVPMKETGISLLHSALRGWAHVALRTIPLGERESYLFLGHASELLEDERWDWDEEAKQPLESISPRWDIAQMGQENLLVRSYRS